MLLQTLNTFCAFSHLEVRFCALFATTLLQCLLCNFTVVFATCNTSHFASCKRFLRTFSPATLVLRFFEFSRCKQLFNDHLLCLYTAMTWQLLNNSLQ